MPAYAPEDADRLLGAVISAGDLGAALALYEPGACLVAAPGQVATGLEAIRQSLSQFMAVWPTLTMQQVTAVQAGALALLSSTWSLTGTGPDGSPVRLAGQGREVVRRQPDGTWLFVIDDPNGGG
jgi:uncharacterized protein (TIGR02246 family)